MLFESILNAEEAHFKSWSRLTSLVMTTGVELARELGCPPDWVLDGCARHLGFEDLAELTSGLAQAGRASAYCASQLSSSHDAFNCDTSFVEFLAGELNESERSALALAPEFTEKIERTKAEDLPAEHYETCESVQIELRQLREEILYKFTRHHCVISPNAVGQAAGLALSLAEDAGNSLSLDYKTIFGALIDVRFGIGWDEELKATTNFQPEVFGKEDSSPEWATRDKARFDRPLKQDIDELKAQHEGYPPCGRLRDRLHYRRCDFIDGAWEAGPPLYLALSHAPDHARFELVDAEGGAPSIYFNIYVRSENDIDSLLQCAPRLPDGVTVVSAAEAENLGAPSLAGWLMVYWD